MMRAVKDFLKAVLPEWAVRLLRSAVNAVSGLRDPRHIRAALKAFYVRIILRREVTITDRNGIKFIVLPEENLYAMFYFNGWAEVGEQGFFKGALRPGMTVFDVGANIGQNTLLFARMVGAKGRVYAFEPCESSIGRLRRNMELNGLENIVCTHVAVTDVHGGSASMNVFPEGYSEWNTLGRPVMHDGERRIDPVGVEDASTVTLDGFCAENGIDMIDFLKVDTEGAELDVLKGALGLLENGAVGYLMFEVSRAMVHGMGRSGSETFELLSRLGYEVHPMSAAGELLPAVTDTDAFYANFIAFKNRADALL